MNDRIKELANQAMSDVMNGSDPHGDADRMYIPADFMEKYAELIVRECLEVVEKQVGGGDDTNGQWDKAINFTYDDIVKHFGVKECH